MKGFAIALAAAGAILAMAHPAHAAILGSETTPAGSAFANACAGFETFGGDPFPGSAFNNGDSITGVLNCQHSTVSGGSTGVILQSFSGSDGGVSFNNNASASASTGFIHVQATNTSAPQVDFAGANSNAGWNDQVSICTSGSPVSCSQVAGIWFVTLFVDGSLASSGGGAWAQMWVGAYVNGDLAADNASSSHNKAFGDINESWGGQAFAFGASGGDSMNVPGMFLTFAIPVTTGVPIELGFFMNAQGSQTSHGAGTTLTTATVNFSDTATWAGPGVFVPNGSNTPEGVTVQSLSGFDYNQSYVPEPGTLALMGAAFGLIGYFRRKS